MSGSATAFAENAGVIGLLASILAWISQRHAVSEKCRTVALAQSAYWAIRESSNQLR